ncbi:serine/threonine protein kinase [Planctomycetales bacterium ZRK34]|nr:serine/threonine protein kinase [Planctomycetales bacterium ZRK34]
MAESSANSPNELLGLVDDESFHASLTSDSLTPEDTVQLDAEPPAAAPSPSNQPAWIGKRMGRFKLLCLLGEGAMGRVVQAMDVNLRRIVALKILRKRVVGIDQEHAVEQFLREARAAAAIEHPNIVRVYEINEHAGWWYIAMEMVEGGTLRDLVKAGGAMSVARVCPLIADAALALAVAHQRGIIHRDIKPNNLMITRDGRCKISDFGLVRYEDPNDPFDFTNKSVGTPRYMAPEVIRQKPPTSAIDIYSLGATLYYGLTGRSPFTGSTISEICQHHLHSPPPDLRDVIPDTPATLSNLVRRMLAKEPADRPSAADVASLLRAEVIELRPDASGSFAMGSTIIRAPLEAESEPPATRIFQHEGRRRRVLVTLIGILAVLIAASSAVLVSRHSGQARNLAEFYPSAPLTYGLREVGAEPPKAAAPDQPPAFSWVGVVQPPEAAKFVASRRGLHYWPIDAAEAKLIRADLVTFYNSAEAATRAGKHLVGQ